MSTFLLSSVCYQVFDHFQFALIHGPNIPGSYAILLLQHQTLLPSPVTCTSGCCFWFGSVSSFFLELFLHWSPVPYFAPTDLRSSSFSVLSFCLFILFMGFSRQYWSGLPFPSPVDLIFSELSTMTRLSWEAIHGVAHSFIELDKAVVHVIRLVTFLWLCFQSVCPLMPSCNTYHLTWVSLTLGVGFTLLEYWFILETLPSIRS